MKIREIVPDARHVARAFVRDLRDMDVRVLPSAVECFPRHRWNWGPHQQSKVLLRVAVMEIGTLDNVLQGLLLGNTRDGGRFFLDGQLSAGILI